ncbi:MAG: hypothetical protein ABI824_15420 [Acidobacteriota bacterium]
MALLDAEDQNIRIHKNRHWLILLIHTFAADALKGEHWQRGWKTFGPRPKHLRLLRAARNESIVHHGYSTFVFQNVLYEAFEGLADRANPRDKSRFKLRLDIDAYRHVALTPRFHRSRIGLAGSLMFFSQDYAK